MIHSVYVYILFPTRMKYERVCEHVIEYWMQVIEYGMHVIEYWMQVIE